MPGRATSSGAIARGLGGVGAVVLALGLGACGGTEPSPDIDEASGTFPVEVVDASFPERQRVSLTSDLVLTVRNTGDSDLPQLAVTVWTGDTDLAAPKSESSFSIPATGDARNRATSVWVPADGFPRQVEGARATAQDIDEAAPGGTAAAQTDTFTFGPLESGATRTLVWRVTAVRAGRHAVNYALAAGLGGAAKAVDERGETPTGRLPVVIDDLPEGCVVGASGPSGPDC